MGLRYINGLSLVLTLADESRHARHSMITELPENTARAEALGIRSRILSRLGKVVVFAGPNGGGKSRYLQLAREMAAEASSHAANRLKYTEQLDSLAVQIKNLSRRLLSASDSASPDRHRQRISSAERQVVQINGKLALLDALKTTKSMAQCSVVELRYRTGKPDQLSDSVSPQQIKQKAEEAPQFDLSHSFVVAHAYLRHMAHALYNGEHPRLAIDELMQQQLATAQDFCSIVNELLQTRFDYKWDGAVAQPVLFGRVFNPHELSEGQCVLLTWAISLHRKGTSLADAIVFIDEPETHLHAGTCVEVLERLHKALGEHGQMWLATHSPSVVARFGLESLYFVKNHDIEWASRKPNVIVEALLGGPEGRERLRTFLGDADKIAFANFLVECLTDATTASHRDGDPQAKQFLDLLKQRLEAGERVKILDYAAGQARFANALQAWLDQPGHQRFRAVLEYHAFNHPQFSTQVDRASCEQICASLVAQGVSATQTTAMDRLKQDHSGQHGFDFVVLCNVLHEVEPAEWLSLFDDLARVLRTEGKLLVMEDLVPTLGELPNRTGFVLLNDVALAALFDARTTDFECRTDSDRIQVVAIPARFITPNKDSRLAALKAVKESAARDMKVARQPAQRNADAGRRHAVNAMQFANASLALERLAGHEG